MSLDGILNIDKPAGITSHDVVARVRRALRTKRVGHAGTLDPDATGVLVVAVGIATRLLPYLPTEPKEYVARVRFGEATDTEDASGRVVEEADASTLSEAALAAVLPRFLGEIQQIPPMVSAVHHEGKRLYELARQGVVVDREPRQVTLHSLVLSDFVPGPRAEAMLQVSCGGGTYIRTLCADIGAALGLPAHMKTLRREAVGRFRAAEAVSLDTLSEADLLPVEQALDFPAKALSEAEAVRISRGQTVATTGAIPPDTDIAALFHRERLLGLAHLMGEELHPFRVFTGPMAGEGSSPEET